jgi:hypothetical protein
MPFSESEHSAAVGLTALPIELRRETEAREDAEATDATAARGGCAGNAQPK